jgi:hypothetical protein
MSDKALKDYLIEVTRIGDPAESKAIMNLKEVDWEKYNGIWRTVGGWTPIKKEDILKIEKWVELQKNPITIINKNSEDWRAVVEEQKKEEAKWKREFSEPEIHKPSKRLPIEKQGPNYKKLLILLGVFVAGGLLLYITMVKQEDQTPPIDAPPIQKKIPSQLPSDTDQIKAAKVILMQDLFISKLIEITNKADNKAKEILKLDEGAQEQELKKEKDFVKGRYFLRAGLSHLKNQNPEEGLNLLLLGADLGDLDCWRSLAFELHSKNDPKWTYYKDIYNYLVSQLGYGTMVMDGFFERYTKISLNNESYDQIISKAHVNKNTDYSWECLDQITLKDISKTMRKNMLEMGLEIPEGLHFGLWHSSTAQSIEETNKIKNEFFDLLYASPEKLKNIIGGN